VVHRQELELVVVHKPALELVVVHRFALALVVVHRLALELVVVHRLALVVVHSSVEAAGEEARYTRLMEEAHCIRLRELPRKSKPPTISSPEPPPENTDKSIYKCKI
jgi:hypothetical protein